MIIEESSITTEDLRLEIDDLPKKSQELPKGVWVLEARPVDSVGTKIQRTNGPQSKFVQ